MKISKGFTLIELLVVIAIIGILASIVLVSFPGASKKAKDSRVISAIAQARTVMTYIYANEGTYNSANLACPSPVGSDIAPLCTEVTNNSYGGAALTIQKTTSAACMYAPLNATNGASWYCADASGVAGTTAVNPGTAPYCTSSSFVCPPVSG